MKRIITVGCFVLVAGTLAAQNRKEDKNKKTAMPAPVAVYFGSSEISGGPVSGKAFTDMARTGLVARDSNAVGARIEGFSFTYIERGIYEDSVGNLIPVVDYLNEYCIGDTLSRSVRRALPEKVKAGDTILIERIRVRMADGAERNGKNMKFVLTR